jgi:hypothetical protein
MNDGYYQAQLEELARQTEILAEKRSTFFQSLLIGSSSLLGILVSLHSTQSACLCIRLVFALAVVLLSLGILATGISLHDIPMYVDIARKEFSREAINASNENRKARPVVPTPKKRTAFCEKSSLVLLIAGLFTLVIYSILSIFI